MVILASTAEKAVERDQRYNRQFHEFTDRLQAIADLHEIELIRDSLVKSAKDLRACAQAMVRESEGLVTRLRSDLSAYQARLDDAEKLAGQDPLTGLDNRRRVESCVEFRTRQQRPFTVLLLDLNGFKKVNDTLGHVAGDELLKQFGAELKASFRATDIVGRWGGDEFIVVLDGGSRDPNQHIQHLARWVLGDYSVRVEGTQKKIRMTAAIGWAEWREGESLESVVGRADAAMYRNKHSSHPSEPPEQGRGQEPARSAGTSPAAPSR